MVLTLLLLEILLIIIPADLWVLVHELINWPHLIAVVLKLISRNRLLHPMLILSGVYRTSLVPTDLLEALHASDVWARLIRVELSLPILHEILLILVLCLRNWRQCQIFRHLRNIHLVVKII